MVDARFITRLAGGGTTEVFDTEFQGPGSVFEAPVVTVCSTAEAAARVARDLNRDQASHPEFRVQRH